MTHLRLLAAGVIAATALAGCSTEKIADNTTDALVGTTKLAARGVALGGRAAVAGGRATVRGVRRLAASEDGFQAGTLVCVDAAGEVYAAARTAPDGRTLCPAPT